MICLQGFDRLHPRKQPSGSSQQQLDPSAHQTASIKKKQSFKHKNELSPQKKVLPIGDKVART
jgi:hypothetical protein